MYEQQLGAARSPSIVASAASAPDCRYVVSTGGRWAKLSLFEVFECLHIERRGQGSRPGRYDWCLKTPHHPDYAEIVLVGTGRNGRKCQSTATYVVVPGF